MEDLRICKICNVEQSIENFGLRHINNRRYWQCNRCKQKIATEWNKTNSLQRLIINSSSRAKSCNLEHSIDTHWLFSTISKICPCCKNGFDMGPTNGRQRVNRPSLDRLDSNLGYTKENTRIICTRCNVIKNSGTLEDHKKIVAWLEAGGPQGEGT